MTSTKKEVDIEGAAVRFVGVLAAAAALVILVFGAYRANKSGESAEETRNVVMQISKKLDDSADGALTLEAEWEDFEQVVRRVRVASKPGEMPSETQARYDEEFEKKFKAYPKGDPKSVPKDVPKDIPKPK